MQLDGFGDPTVSMQTKGRISGTFDAGLREAFQVRQQDTIIWTSNIYQKLLAHGTPAHTC